MSHRTKNGGNMMDDNEKGYIVYLWEQRGYNFIPDEYNENRDFKKYLNYFTDENENKRLRMHLGIDSEK